MKWTNEWIKTFPTRFDLIIGIPRSGMIIASIIATKLGKPLTTPECFLENHLWASKALDKNKNFRSILLVDDSINSGNSMQTKLELLKPRYENNITTAALLTTNNSKNLVDLYYKVIPQPRVFEWNLMHSKKGNLVSEMDGVICENCPFGVNTNEKIYVEWLKNAKPYLIPSFEIDVILSNRLEKYRQQTEKWLKYHNVRYKKLILSNLSSRNQRKGNHAKNKVESLLKIKPDMFWESNYTQAKVIWNATKIPTISIDKMVMISAKD